MDNINKLQKHTFTEQEKESNQEFSVNSEEIASFMIEKLISLAITEEQRRKTSDQIPNKCFSYLSEMIKNYLQLEFLPHDIDDYINEKAAESLYSHEMEKHPNKITSSWMPISNLKYKANVENLNKVNNNKNKNEKKAKEQAENISEKDDDFSNENDSSHSTIKRENSKQSIDSHSLHKQISDPNENIFFENAKTIFYDNCIFGVNDWTINEEPVLFI
jgi:hypothetical protein